MRFLQRVQNFADEVNFFLFVPLVVDKEAFEPQVATPIQFQAGEIARELAAIRLVPGGVRVVGDSFQDRAQRVVRNHFHEFEVLLQ